MAVKYYLEDEEVDADTVKVKVYLERMGGSVELQIENLEIGNTNTILSLTEDGKLCLFEMDEGFGLQLDKSSKIKEI